MDLPVITYNTSNKIDTFSVFEVCMDVASGFYIYKQPLIYIHTIHAS